jgi:CRISPR/Cas system endoribonuclease Cas6 (RAMP superfamily)
MLPTSANLASSLAFFLPRRLGISLEPDSIRLKIFERHTQFEHVEMGDKFGKVGGFVGHMIVDTNATGHWLLKCAETLGFGGRVSFGFGRIRVSEVDAR